MKIGLFGFGCVGQGLYDIICKVPSAGVSIAKIAVKSRDKPRTVNPDLLVFEPEAILGDPEIDLVVELIDDPIIAYYIGKTALLRNKHFISANKQMLSSHRNELEIIAQEKGMSFLFEGAVCGSIPIIRNLEGYLGYDTLSGISGIFNGSCNYILTLMEEKGLEFSAALKRAQEAGFAESNPTLDIEGYDALHKTIILAEQGFDIQIKPVDILRWGIQHVSAAHLAFAQGHNLKIKQICTIKVAEKHQLSITTVPTIVTDDDALFHIREEYNAVRLDSLYTGHQVFSGKGAGSHPTGYAVFSDIVACRQGFRYKSRGSNRSTRYSVLQDGVHKVFLSNKLNRWPDNLKSAADEIYKDENDCLIGTFQLKTLLENTIAWQEQGIFMAMLSEPAFQRILAGHGRASQRESIVALRQTSRQKAGNC